jgi:hypothetical protein
MIEFPLTLHLSARCRFLPVLFLAVVGLTEEAAVAAGHPCCCNTLPMALVPRAGTIRDTRGVIKMGAEAEALKIAAISRFKDPGKLSCCAE